MNATTSGLFTSYSDLWVVARASRFWSKILNRPSNKERTTAPGLFLTPMLQTLRKEVRESLAASIPFPRRLGQADEYARLVLHVLSNHSLTGETIRLDGALRLPPR